MVITRFEAQAHTPSLTRRYRVTEPDTGSRGGGFVGEGAQEGEKIKKAREFAPGAGGASPGGKDSLARGQGYLIVPRARSEGLRGLQTPRRYRSPAGFADFLRHKLSINFLHAETVPSRHSKRSRSARLSAPPLPAEP